MLATGIAFHAGFVCAAEGALCSPFISCDFALPPHRRGRADCSVLPVFFNKPGTVASSFTQTHVWSDCQTAKAHSLHHTPPPPQLPCALLCLHHISSPAHSRLRVTFYSFELEFSSPPVSTSHPPFPFPQASPTLLPIL